MWRDCIQNEKKRVQRQFSSIFAATELLCLSLTQCLISSPACLMLAGREMKGENGSSALTVRGLFCSSPPPSSILVFPEQAAASVASPLACERDMRALS